jgi:large subunit ribosomal protein L21
MYAVIKTGGKQYKVAAGEKLKVEQITAAVGQEVVFDQVLALGAGADLVLGTPLVPNATVKATVVAHGLHDKVRIFKMRRRKHYKKSQGHRQRYAVGAASVAVPQSLLAPAGADDLVKIEGIGPKINGLLVDAGISTFAQLAATPVDKLQAILKAAGSRYATHNPTTWPEQAKLAAEGKWDEFKKLTDELVAGVRK